MRKLSLLTTVALAAFVLAFSYMRPEVVQNLFRSEELYSTHTPTILDPMRTAQTTEAVSDIAPAAGTMTVTDTASTVTPAPTPEASTTTTADTTNTAATPADTAATAPQDAAVKAALPTPTTTSATEEPKPAVEAAAVQPSSGKDEATASADAPASAVAAPASADTTKAADTKPEANIDLAVAMQDHVLGSTSAPLTVYDYSSMSCPHCANFHTTIFPKVKQYYIDTGKVRWVYRTFPHNDPGLRAEMLARCVPSDQYSKIRDLVFSNQERWAFSQNANANLAMLVKIAGIDQERFEACTTSKALEGVILKIAQDGSDKYKVGSTPTFVFNDGAKKLEGAGSYETFAYELDYFLSDLADKAKAATQSTPAPSGKL